MLAGTLEIQLLANMAKLQKDMDEAKRSVGTAMSAIERSVGMAKSALGALGAGVSLAALAAIAARAIDAADAMNDLSQRVGITVKDLAKYELASSQSGTTMESLAKGIKGLSGNLMEHGAALKKAGITATDADGALRQVADVFARLPDGMEKTTLAVKLFGKSGMDLIPMLNMGSKGLEDAAEKSAKYAKQMAIMAPLADTYNDNMAEMAMHNKVFGMSLVNEVLPGLIVITRAMADAAKEGGLLAATWAGMQAVFHGDDMHKANMETVKSLDLVMAAENALTKARADGDTARIERLEKALVLRKAEFAMHDGYRRMLEEERNPTPPKTAAGKPKTDPLADYKALMAALGGDEAGKKAQHLIDAAKELASGLLQQDLGLSPDFLKKWDQLNLAYTKGGLSLESLTKAQKVLLDQQPFMTKEMKNLHEVMQARSDLRNKENEGIDAYLEKQQEAYNAAVKGSNDELKAAKANFEQYGLNRSQIAAITIATLQAEQAKLQAWSEGYKALQIQIDNQQKLVDVLKNTEALDQQVSMWQSIEQTAHTTFTNIFEGGQDAFTKLRDTLKATLLDLLYQMTVKRWIFDISASVSGQGVAQSAIGSAGSLISGASGAASLFSGTGAIPSALASAGTAITSFGNAALASTQSMLGITGTTAQMAQSLSAAGYYGTSSLATTLGTVAPYALAALAVFQLLTSKGEYVKSTGSSVQYFDKTGATTSTSALSNNFNTPEADKRVADMQAAYMAGAKALGISNAGGMFAYASNNSDGGKFGIQVGVGTANYSTGELKATDEAIKLEAARAVFAALQGSELPSYLKGAFDGITASTATEEQINSALTYAQNIKVLHDQFDALPFESLKDLSLSATKGLIEFSGGLDKLGANLSGYYQNYYSAEEQRAQTITNIVKTLNAAGASLTNADVEGATRDTFRALVEGVKDLETEAGQKTYAALLSVQGAFASVTDVVKETTATVNDLADAQRELQSAWSAEGARLDAINKAKADALATAQKTVADLRNEATMAYLTAQQRVTAAQQGVANILHSTIASFQDVIDSMNGGRNTTESRADALGNLNRLADLARGGDTAAIGKIPDAVKKFVTLSADASATREAYRMDEAYARSILQEGIDAGKKQLETLPVEMQKATDPIKAAYDELTKATKAENDARVLAIAMQASLTDTEKSLGDKYLDAIKGLTGMIDGMPEGEKLAKFYNDTMTAAAAAAAIAETAATAAKKILEDLSKTTTTTTSTVTAGGGGSITLPDNTKYTAGLVGGGVYSNLHDINGGSGASTGTGSSFVAKVGTSITTDGMISRNSGEYGTQLFWARDVAALLNDFAAANGRDAAIAEAAKYDLTGAMLDQVRKYSVGLPQFDMGTNFLPRDMLIQAHAGETITPSNYVDIERDAREQTNALLARLVDSNAALTTRVEALTTAAQTTAVATSATATATERHVALAEQVAEGDMSYQTRAAGTDNP